MIELTSAYDTLTLDGAFGEVFGRSAGLPNVSKSFSSIYSTLIPSLLRYDQLVQ